MPMKTTTEIQRRSPYNHMHIDQAPSQAPRNCLGSFNSVRISVRHKMKLRMTHGVGRLRRSISRKFSDLHKMPHNFLMSAVVLMEIMASVSDLSKRKVLEHLFRQHQKHNSLIVPNDDDWLLASKILYLLTHARRRSHKGKLHRLPPGASQRLGLDVLIAVSARRW